MKPEDDSAWSDFKSAESTTPANNEPTDNEPTNNLPTSEPTSLEEEKKPEDM